MGNGLQHFGGILTRTYMGMEGLNVGESLLTGFFVGESLLTGFHSDTAVHVSQNGKVGKGGDVPLHLGLH